MVNAAAFLQSLLDCGVGFFSGVPDTVLANFCFAIHDRVSVDSHVLAANEGGAVAAAAGYYLATGQIGAVYLQNSGQGNAVNPLTSLVNDEVFGIPVLLLVGWRGEPNKPDGAEHQLQGRITLPLLELLGIPTEILPEDDDGAAACARNLVAKARASGKAVAALVRATTFGSSHYEQSVDPFWPTRERAIELILQSLPENSIVVSTTGKASREVYEMRDLAGQQHDRDFLMIGSMGHASQIAHGLALGRPEQKVVCLDGDGAVIMHMGSLAVIGSSKPANFYHVILNNHSYDSVGGHPSVAAAVDFLQIAQSCGYARSTRACGEEELRQHVGEMLQHPGPALLEVRVRRGARSSLGRPHTNPRQNRVALRERLSPAHTAGSIDLTTRQKYERDGFVIARQLLSPGTIRDLELWIEDLAALANGDSSLYCYYEASNPGLLRQIENFCPVHARLHQFALGESLINSASLLLGEPAILFKDKINFKFPGGAGYEPHRDGRFWWRDSDGVRRPGWNAYAPNFLNVLIAVDPTNALNGCLEIVAGKHRDGDLECYGPLSEDQTGAMHFEPCPTEPGDVIFFDAMAPHRSGPNLSDKGRRALYLTYHARAAGDCRERYFKDKRFSLTHLGAQNR